MISSRLVASPKSIKKAISIKELELEALPPILIQSTRSPTESKLTSRVHFQASMKLLEHTQARVNSPILLNSSSEEKDIVVKTKDNQANSRIYHSRLNSKHVANTGSQINIDSGVLESPARHPSGSPTDKGSKLIKVPNVPNNALGLDYLTDGSAGSAEGRTVRKRQTR